MIQYKVTGAKPSGKMYHGPGNALTKKGMSLYHLTNSIRGVETAAAQGYQQIDNDFMMTKDGVIVCCHSYGVQDKEGFTSSKVPNKPVHLLTWEQVKQLTGPEGYKIQRIETMFKQYAKHGIWVAFELKGNSVKDWRMCQPETIDMIIDLANEHNVKIYMKSSSRYLQYRNALYRARKRGLWTRYNGSWAYRKPTN